MPLSENGSATENTAGSVSFWYDPGKRSILYQVVTLCMVGLLAYYLISNTLANLERQSIATGFGFIQREASFEIGEALIPYSAADSYGRALVVGTLNTLLVSFIGIILTVILGTLIGVARLSSNWLVSKLAAIYTELFQDIPRSVAVVFLVCFFL
jgi:general L-amino acid transport system permease protein